MERERGAIRETWRGRAREEEIERGREGERKGVDIREVE